MHVERLTALANWLEGGAQHKLRIGNRDVVFDMSQGIQVLSELGQDFDPTECGTACCVAGAAVEFFAPTAAVKLISAVRAEALAELEDDLDELDESDWRSLLQVGFQSHDESRPLVFERARDLLDLTDEQAVMLFIPTEPIDGYDPPEHLELRDFSDPAWAARTIRHGLATGCFDWMETQQ